MMKVVAGLSGGVDSIVPPKLKLRKGRRVRVAVGLSGGVDSAVSTALLLEQGFEVTGVFLECWGAPGCRVDEDRRDAMDVALKLGIPFEVLDFRKEYREKVVEYFYREYRAGRTPNPDTMCNREIKFGMFYEWALRQAQGKQSKFDYVATGHYARIDQVSVEEKQYVLKRGVDEKKDQSYFLYLLRQEQLPHILFPLGEMTKSEVRKKAHESGLKVAKKPDSQGICFIGEVSVKQFLQELGMEEKRGEVLLKLKVQSPKPKATSGGLKLNADHFMEIGQHEGAWFYTVGQRHGFKIKDLRFKNKDQETLFRLQLDTSAMPPLYVLHKDTKQNILIVGTREQVMRREFEVDNLHFVNEDLRFKIHDLRNIRVRIRHGGELISAKLKTQNSKPNIDEQIIQVTLREEAFGVAAGQACVFYENEVCLGGGVIL